MADTSGIEALVNQQRLLLAELKQRIEDVETAKRQPTQPPLEVTPFGAAILACKDAAELQKLLAAQRLSYGAG